MRADRTWITKTLMLSPCLAVVALLGSAPASVAAGGLEGSSCSHPYRYVRDLRRWYRLPATITDNNEKGPYTQFHVHNVRGEFNMDFGNFNEEGIRATLEHPLPINYVEFDAQWWLATGDGRLCQTRITFHGLPPFITHSRGSIGRKSFTFRHVHSQWPLKLEVTSAR